MVEDRRLGKFAVILHADVAGSTEMVQRLINAWDEYARSIGVIPPEGGPFGE